VGPRERAHLAGEFWKVKWTESALENDGILTSSALGGSLKALRWRKWHK